jgi:hypothetical protein
VSVSSLAARVAASLEDRCGMVVWVGKNSTVSAMRSPPVLLQ